MYGVKLAMPLRSKSDVSTPLKMAPMRSDSTSTVDSDTAPFNAMKQQLFKTKMCRHFLNGRCKYSEKCTFSHDHRELTVRNDFAKTKLCKKLNCSDLSCGYAHSVSELRVPTAALCPTVASNQPCRDRSCKFSHNTTYFEELQVANRALQGGAEPNPSTPTIETAESYSGLSTPSAISEPLAADLVQALIHMLSMAKPEPLH